MQKENARIHVGEGNRGFSLVELIIVIAIMAILVGVMAPQLIKYIEKTNVSADVQLCDAIHTAIVTACMDPAVLADPHSQAAISWYTTGPHDGTQFWLKQFAYVDDSTAFGSAVIDTLGLTSTTGADVHAELKAQFRSSPAKTTGALGVMVMPGNGNFHIYISNSDNTGEKNSYSPAQGGSNNDKVIMAPAWVD